MSEPPIQPPEEDAATEPVTAEVNEPAENDPEITDPETGDREDVQQGSDTAEAVVEDAPPKTFEELGLSRELLRALYDFGFEMPRPIQSAVIEKALAGRDIVGLAETGSGKTAAFCLPMLQRLIRGGGLRGLVVCPTREIALQTQAFLEQIGPAHHLRSACVIGGVRFEGQLAQIEKRPDVVVATPGRLLDHCGRGNLSLAGVKELVLDEADHMFDLGFLPQIHDILSQVPEDRHTMMFSATMPPPIEVLARRHLRDAETMDLRPDGRAAEGIEHRLYLIAEKDKKDCILKLLENDKGSTLVFIRRKTDAEWLSRVLEKRGHPVERIHSNLSQASRVKALRGFREGQHRILVATDIAARGLDIPRIEHIINYDLPDDVADYIHRAGRTARGDREGVVSSIASWRNKPMIRRIEATLGFPLPRLSVEGVESWVERSTLAERRRRSPLRR